MSWFKKKDDANQKDKLKSEIDVVLEHYKPEIVRKLEEFNRMDCLKTIKYIRTWTLLREIERTHLIKKLLILWLSGIFNFILKWFNKDTELEALDKKTLALVIEDTQLNYVKKSYLFRDINTELKKLFVNAGISFEPVNIADYLQKPLVIESKGHKRRLQTRLLKRLGSLSSAAKLPSLLFPFFAILPAFIGIVLHYLFRVINNLQTLLAITPVMIHFTTGVLKAWGVFSEWIDAIANQIGQEAPSSQAKANNVVDGWILYFKDETEKQFDLKVHSRKFRRFATATCTVLVLTLASYAFIYQDKPVAYPKPFENSHGETTPNTPDSVPIDRNKILRKLQNQKIMTVLEGTGSDKYETSFSKEIFGGTIPETTVKIVVNYDYTVRFDVNLGQLTESLVQTNDNSVQVLIPSPIMTEVQVSNYIETVEKGFFASGDDPRKEIEQHDSGNDSYIDILKRNTREKLINDEELKNKAKSEALDKVRILVEESIDDTEVMVQVSCGN